MMNENIQSNFTTENVFDKLRVILCDILVLNPEDVQMSSKLVDDLDADSIAFLELTFQIRNEFGLQVPDAKVDEETLTMPLLEGVEKLEKSLGGTTLFEYMKQEAAKPGGANTMGLGSMLDTSAAGLERMRSLTLDQLAEQMGTSLPGGMEADAPISKLELRDLFRFITVESYVRYIQSLANSQDLIQELGGADKMNLEVTEKLRENRDKGQ